MIDTRKERQRSVVVYEASGIARRIDTEQQLIHAIAEQRLENPVPGDVMKSDDGQVKYKIEHHANGRHTFHRETPKLSKAEKKRAKRAKHATR